MRRCIASTDLGRKVSVESLEAFVQAQVVSDGVLPGHSDLLLLEVGEPLLDGHVDVVETHGLGGVAVNGDHDQLLVAEGRFRKQSWVDLTDRRLDWDWLESLEDAAHSGGSDCLGRFRIVLDVHRDARQGGQGGRDRGDRHLGLQHRLTLPLPLWVSPGVEEN